MERFEKTPSLEEMFSQAFANACYEASSLDVPMVVPDLKQAAEALAAHFAKAEPCMSLNVMAGDGTVNFVLDTSRPTYYQWVDGNRGECGLIRDAETDDVIGIELRMIRDKLAVWHEGPVRVNQPFLKGECDED